MKTSQNFFLKKHTLHLPIRNRPKWLKYTLSMYRIYGYTGTILLADDSDDEIYNQNKSIIKNFDDISINHFRAKNNYFEEQHRRYNLTKFQSYKEIDTEYYSCTSDDDLFNTSFAIDGIKFLEMNLDFSAVTGAEIKLFYDEKFHIKNTSVKWWPTSKYEDALDRLLEYTYNPSAAYLGVCRTSSLQDVFELERQENKLCFVRQDDDWGFPSLDMEIPWMFQLYISGKIGRIYNKISSFRGEHNSSDRYTLEYLQKNDKKKRSLAYGPIIEILNDTASKSLKNTYNDLFFLLCKKSNYSKEIVEDVLLRSLWTIFTKYNYFNIISGETKFGQNFLAESNISKIQQYRIIKFSEIFKKNNSRLKKFFLKQISRKIKQVKFNYAKIEFKKLERSHLEKHRKLRHILEK